MNNEIKKKEIAKKIEEIIDLLGVKKTQSIKETNIRVAKMLPRI